MAISTPGIFGGRRLPAEFFRRSDVIEAARDLLGCILVSSVDGSLTAGRIVETEAYRAPDDKACHAFGNRRTARTEVMFAAGGHAYVYLCYGIHHLFNVVTGQENEAHAVLVRAIEPLHNLPLMQSRRGMRHKDRRLTGGPGKLAEALGIHTRHSGMNMLDPESLIWIEPDPGKPVDPADIASGPRIGVESAGQCATWPWRFYLEHSPWVSR